MIEISATRLNPVLPHYHVIFDGDAKVLQILLELLKVGAQWNATVKSEIDRTQIDATIRQIAEGR